MREHATEVQGGHARCGLIRSTWWGCSSVTAFPSRCRGRTGSCVRRCRWGGGSSSPGGVRPSSGKSLGHRVRRPCCSSTAWGRAGVSTGSARSRRSGPSFACSLPICAATGAASVRGDAFRLADCADDLAALLDVLATGPVLVAGYSMGGPVAQLLSRRHPERVAGLVLCATAPRFSLGSSRCATGRCRARSVRGRRAVRRTRRERAVGAAASSSSRCAHRGPGISCSGRSRSSAVTTCVTSSKPARAANGFDGGSLLREIDVPDRGRGHDA